MTNQFSTLANRLDSNDATLRYENFVEAISSANKKLLQPIPRRRSNDPASDPRVAEARYDLIAAKEVYHASPTEEARVIVAEKKNHLSSCYNTIQEETITNKITLAESATDRCKNKESWRLINDISGRKKRGLGLVEGGSAQGRLEAWKTHFTKLLGQPPQVPSAVRTWK